MQPPLSSKHLPSNQQSPAAPPLLFFSCFSPHNFLITLGLPLPPSLAFVLVDLSVNALTIPSRTLSFAKRTREKFEEVAMMMTTSYVEMDSRDSVMKVPCPERNDEMVTDDTEETRSRISDRYSNLDFTRFGSELVCDLFHARFTTIFFLLTHKRAIDKIKQNNIFLTFLFFLRKMCWEKSPMAIEEILGFYIEGCRTY